uniref:HNHc domain-containing protein n=1 Tax=Rhabditophanes sp. KR3021 TaxID=114890 RepID=A0AC35U638_9BILA
MSSSFKLRNKSTGHYKSIHVNGCFQLFNGVDRSGKDRRALKLFRLLFPAAYEGIEWIPSSFNPKYSVSNSGLVRNDETQYLLKPCKREGTTYWTVQMRAGMADDIQCERCIHREVTIAFHGTPPTPVHQANHISGDIHDNSAGNLEWTTPSENVQHAHGNGLYGRHTRVEGARNFEIIEDDTDYSKEVWEDVVVNDEKQFTRFRQWEESRTPPQADFRIQL